MQDRLKLVVCRYCLREAKAALRADSVGDVDVCACEGQCVRPHVHSAPMDWQDPPPQGDVTDNLLVGTCHSPPKQGVSREEEAEQALGTNPGFYLMAPRPLIDSYIARGAYIVTPGWLKGWRDHLEEWALDRTTSREFFRECCSEIALLDTMVEVEVGEHLREMGAYLDLPVASTPIGIDHFGLVLKSIIQDWRLRKAGVALRNLDHRSTRKLSDRAMALDLVTRLTRMMNEEEAISAILESCEMLFGARSVRFMRSTNATDDASTRTELEEGLDHRETEKGFVLRLAYQGQTLGFLIVEDIALPQHRADYLNLALELVAVCGLAIHNARAVTRIRETEQALTEKMAAESANAAKLEAANKELEAFAYAVSHDLRAPLRALSGFSHALMEDYGPKLTGEAHVFLGQITLASRRMGELIDGLLTLSRSTRGELQWAEVDLSARAELILDEHAKAEPSRLVTWTVEPGLIARCDSRLIEVVLTNLLDNAWKYTGGTAAPKVRFYAEHRGDEQIYCVSDNGAGFDMRHAAKLFQPFQRLHRQDEFPGIGIGLATVQRIVHRHGGRIQATAAPGKGAVFSFSLQSDLGEGGQ